MTSVLLRNGRVHGSDATAVAWDGTTITWVGPDAGAPVTDETVDLAGALVTPGFVDHHVHTVRTGFARTGLDLTDSPSLARVLADLAAHAAERPGDGVLVGQGWDETDSIN